MEVKNPVENLAAIYGIIVSNAQKEKEEKSPQMKRFERLLKKAVRDKKKK